MRAILAGPSVAPVRADPPGWGRLDRSVLKAIRYARQIEAIYIGALHAGLDPQHRQRLLHDRTSRTIARALVDEPHVDVVAVPYHLHGRVR